MRIKNKLKNKFFNLRNHVSGTGNKKCVAVGNMSPLIHLSIAT